MKFEIDNDELFRFIVDETDLVSLLVDQLEDNDEKINEILYESIDEYLDAKIDTDFITENADFDYAIERALENYSLEDYLVASGSSLDDLVPEFDIEDIMEYRGGVIWDTVNDAVMDMIETKIPKLVRDLAEKEVKKFLSGEFLKFTISAITEIFSTAFNNAVKVEEVVNDIYDHFVINSKNLAKVELEEDNILKFAKRIEDESNRDFLPHD